jgi:hypothetical protein
MTEEIAGELVAYDQQAHYMSVVERLASNPDVDVDKLQKILDMQEHQLNRDAEKAYNSDMVLAQAEIRVVVKNKHNQQTRSDYADLTAIIASAKPIYTNHGFALSFYEGVSPKEKHIRVMVDVLHRMGHKETRFHDVPLDMFGIAGKANKTLVHGGGSSISYGRRYLTCMVFNIPTGDDDDGNAAGGNVAKYVEGGDLELIKKLHGEVAPKAAQFLKFAGAKSLDTIPLENFEKVLGALNERKVELAKKKNDDSKRQPGQEG